MTWLSPPAQARLFFLRQRASIKGSARGFYLGGFYDLF
jgi:hypothetical protein